MFVPSFLALWWPKIDWKSRFPQLFAKTVSSIHFIPGIYHNDLKIGLVVGYFLMGWVLIRAGVYCPHLWAQLVCIVELLVSSVICRFQGLSYSHVPECVEFPFILFIDHNIHFYFELYTYCNILDIYLLWNMNSDRYLFYMELMNCLFCDMFGGILECYELTHILPHLDPTRQSSMSG